MAARKRFLAKPLALPQVARFEELFDAWAPWNVDYPSSSPPISGVRVPAEDYNLRTGKTRPAYMIVGPFLIVEPGRHALAARPSELTLVAIRTGTISIAYDTMSFETHVHDPDGALVTTSHSQIIGTLWLAFVDPATVPAWLPAGPARDLFVQARRDNSGDAYLVTADAIEEYGGEEFERSAALMRTFATDAYAAEKKRARAYATSLRRAQKRQRS